MPRIAPVTTRANVTLDGDIEDKIESAYSNRFWAEMSMARKVRFLAEEGLKLRDQAEVLAALLAECDRSGNPKLVELANKLKSLVSEDVS